MAYCKASLIDAPSCPCYNPPRAVSEGNPVIPKLLSKNLSISRMTMPPDSLDFINELRAASSTRPQAERVHRTGRIRRLLLLSFLSVLILMITLASSGRLNRAWSLSNTDPEGEALKSADSPAGLNSSPALILTNTSQPTPTASQTYVSPTPTPSPAVSLPLSQAQTVSIEIDSPFKTGTLFLSLLDMDGRHLFAYNPLTLPFTRLTSGKWEDITPSPSPDGTRLAFSSNRDGQWDIYTLNLHTGAIRRITDTPEYDAYPSWSPDSQWLVYESYTLTELSSAGEYYLEIMGLSEASHPSGQLENLELFILQIDADADPIRLTTHPAADFAPVWSPAGRQIAFVSNRSGEQEIWIADLNQIDDRFQNISNNPASADKFPTWSPDGNTLAWSAYQAGFTNIFVKSLNISASRPQLLGVGDRPVWSPVDGALITAVSTPNLVYLTGYLTGSPGMALPAVPLPSQPEGITWGFGELPFPLPEYIQQAASELSQTSGDISLVGVPGERQQLVEVQDIEAPYPLLNDLVDEYFYALRLKLAETIGWDYLSSLENAFIPLTTPLFPGMLSDWLYTGRAITLNPAPINAGWMLVTREDFGSETYWRIYLKTRFQNGSQGRPLYDSPWNFNARYSGDPRFYEAGGASTSVIPSGYWFDFTQLASSYGWQRLPALIIWRSALPAARFNEFVRTDGLDWLTAMGELYPPAALSTPTPVLPPTFTPTATRWPTRTPIPTRTPWPSRTPSPTP